ncbi:MAG: nuclear transport factor 2 family protein [Mycobacteriales bacterium]
MDAKTLVTTTLTTLADTGDPAPAVERFYAPDFVQHSPIMPPGRDSLIPAFIAFKSAGIKYELMRVVAEGDLVAVHSRAHGMVENPMVIFHLFRVEDGRIAEHWEAMMEEIVDTVGGRSMVDGPTEVTDLDATEANKKLVTRLTEEAFIGADWSNLDAYVNGDRLIQHDPHIPDGASSVPAAFALLEAAGTPMTYRALHRVVAEGNFVFTQSEGDCVGKPHAFSSLFRVEDGKIAEHWDVVAELPEPGDVMHDNGLF